MSGRSLLYILALCVIFTGIYARNSPVVIIPGLTESQLEAKINRTTVIHPYCRKHADWHPVWYDELLLIPPNNECFLDDFQLLYNNETRQSYSPEGVEIKPIGFGDLKGINYYDVSDKFPYWANITEPLIKDYGYRVGYDLFGAPYDWRYGPNRYVDFEYPQLIQLIEDVYHLTGLPVILMSVSMGGTYTALFLNLQTFEWKSTYIRGWISLSGVFSGSSEAIAQLVTNDPTGRFKFVKNIDAVSKGFGSIAWLMPTTVAFSPDQVFATTATANYTITNFTLLFEEANETVAGALYQDTLPYTAFTPPEVEVFCVWGYNLSTPNVIQVLDTTFMNFTATEGNGDTIVLVESLAVCSNDVWGKQQNQTVHTIPQPNVAHADQFETPEGVQQIIDIIINQLAPIENKAD